MTTCPNWRSGGHGFALLLAALVFLSGHPAFAQQQDRERAQLRQMQQQVQKLMQDNTSLQRDNSELKQKVSEGEKKSSEATQSLAALRRRSQSDQHDLEAARDDLRVAKDELAKLRADNERLTTETQKREDALQVAAETQAQMRKSFDAERLELGHRVTQQNERADLCERKHAELVTLSEGILDRYERAKGGLIGEPVTRIFAVRAQATVQQLRDQIYDLRLDLPPAAASR